MTDTHVSFRELKGIGPHPPDGERSEAFIPALSLR